MTITKVGEVQVAYSGILKVLGWNSLEYTKPEGCKHIIGANDQNKCTYSVIT